MNVRMPARVPRLLAAVLLCEGAGAVGAVAVRDSIDSWYRTVHKPAYNPPNWVFGPVWTLLYALMGVAVYLAGESDQHELTRPARVLFGLQLGLNVLWSYLFFGRRSPLYALIEIVALWIAILATVVAFARVSRIAALLLVPYLAWTSFAALLNFSIWRLNRGPNK